MEISSQQIIAIYQKIYNLGRTPLPNEWNIINTACDETSTEIRFETMGSNFDHIAGTLTIPNDLYSKPEHYIEQWLLKFESERLLFAMKRTYIEDIKKFREIHHRYETILEKMHDPQWIQKIIQEAEQKKATILKKLNASIQQYQSVNAQAKDEQFISFIERTAMHKK